MYCGVGYRPHTVQRVALGASRDGRLGSIVHDGYQETSAYEEFSEALVSATGFLHSCSNVYTRRRIARLNVHTLGHMRGPGEVSGIFALESAMDELAVALNIDPIELRLACGIRCRDWRAAPAKIQKPQHCRYERREDAVWQQCRAERVLRRCWNRGVLRLQPLPREIHVALEVPMSVCPGLVLGPCSRLLEHGLETRGVHRRRDRITRA
jgi:CO/xanthine dehydrogenase Mo-binding subunit